MAITSAGNSRITTSNSWTSTANYSYHFWGRSPTAPGGTDAFRTAFGLRSTTSGGGGDFTEMFLWTGTSGGTTRASQHQQGGISSYVYGQLSDMTAADTWYGVGLTYDGSNIRAYLNGVLKSTTTASQQSLSMQIVALGFTYSATSVQLPLAGTLAEAGVWTVALTDDEMLSLGSGLAPTFIRPGSLKVYWPLVGNVTDIMGNGASEGGDAMTVDEHIRVLYPNIENSIWPPLNTIQLYYDVTITTTMSMLFNPVSVQESHDYMTLSDSLRDKDIHQALKGDKMVLTDKIKAYSKYLSSGGHRELPGDY